MIAYYFSHPWVEPNLTEEFEDGVRIISSWNFKEVVKDSP